MDPYDQDKEPGQDVFAACRGRQAGSLHSRQH